MKEAFITDLLIIGTILVFLHGLYENNYFLTFLCLNKAHFPSVLKYFNCSNTYNCLLRLDRTPLCLMLQKILAETKFCNKWIQFFLVALSVKLVAAWFRPRNTKHKQKGIKWFIFRALLKRNIGFKWLWRKQFINIRSDGKTKRISKSYVF